MCMTVKSDLSSATSTGVSFDPLIRCAMGCSATASDLKHTTPESTDLLLESAYASLARVRLDHMYSKLLVGTASAPTASFVRVMLKMVPCHRLLHIMLNYNK